MLRIRTLGGVSVEGADGPLGGAAAQRKSLALLALLASAGDRGLSRDKILAYLWPETDASRAGHRLTQLLYTLRRDLQLDDLFLATADLRLNADRADSDLAGFGCARRAGQLEQAVACYGGPFLDGFFLSGSPEFERWVDGVRADLARDYAEVIETLAAEAGARGQHRDAVQWWQRLADHDPLSSRVTVHLMSALAAAGDRAAALERARAYQEQLERELAAAPNPAILALAGQLRRYPVDPRPRSEAAPRVITIGVLPFLNLSAVPDNDHFAEGVSEEVASALAGIDGLRVAARTSVSALANTDLDAREIGRRLDLAMLLEGSVRQAGNQVRLHTHLIDAADGCSLWSAKYERLIDDAFTVQGELAARVVAGVLGALAGRRPAPAIEPVVTHGA
ncbi:MAG TPA: BTAD domain-containing putative transcriptional regulator [Gemmatimonadales bacterium]